MLGLGVRGSSFLLETVDFVLGFLNVLHTNQGQ
jgi:hypothetical protein